MRTLTERDPVVMNDGSLKQLNEVGGGGGETYTLPAATANTLGGVKIGGGVTVAEDGTISVSSESYTLPAATADTLGGVKIGDGVTVAEDGTISVSGGGGGYTTITPEIRRSGVNIKANASVIIGNMLFMCVACEITAEASGRILRYTVPSPIYGNVPFMAVLDKGNDVYETINGLVIRESSTVVELGVINENAGTLSISFAIALEEV